eukprot:TRINITY_DN24441_c0_g1_i1.p1 TRINITY_DN24441_c0_g1~~TRINITY_DN24441_c0_g1_i1.p1  ORF type:complete len:562 (-),score=87.86 TRINITY_DN24441_c0_g1_i1:55-1740(-)
MGTTACVAACHCCKGIACDADDDEDKFCPDENLSALVWYGVGQRGFLFPERRANQDGVKSLISKPNLAICISGGGFRATTCALGWIRGLWQLGVVQRSQYLCSNSGGSWFNAAFSYQDQVSVEDFLGSYTAPADLTREKASEREDGSYAKVVADANGMMGSLAEDIFCNAVCCRTDEDGLRLRAWEAAVGKGFLSPFGIGHSKQAFALAGRGEERARQTGVPNVCSACRSPDMPYPILVGTMMLEDDPLIFQSYEFTPQYAGMPATIQRTPQVQVGGVLVETYAASSCPPTTVLSQHPGSCNEVELEVKWILPLAEAAGISSQYLAQNYSGRPADDEDGGFQGANEDDDGHAFSWMGYFNGQHEGQDVQFGDGGGTDNIAVLPAVRRGMRKLIICAAVGTPPDDDWAGYNYDISGLFGATPEGRGPAVRAGTVSAADWNRHIQVFERRAWDEMFGIIYQQHASGRPLVARVKSRVLPNMYQGVEGNYDVDMVWIFNGGADAWREHVPEETCESLEHVAKRFPYISVNLLDYPPLLVNCMSNLAAWNVFEAQGQILNLLQSP